MSDPCCESYGGLITIEGGGVRFQVRGDVMIEPTNREIAAEAHHDGTPYFVEKPSLYRAEFDFSAGCDSAVWEVLKRCSVNVTLVAELSGRTETHLWTGGRFTGKPKQNLSTGAISGSSYAAGKYRKLAA